MASSANGGGSADGLARIQAELAAKEREALDAIKEDVCEWLTTVLELKVTAQTFMEVLDTGIALCKLVTLIQRSAKAAEDCGKSLNFKVPMYAISCNAKAEHGSFYARDNASNFIGWCRELGVEEAVIFESDGLVVHRDEKRVILCLLDVARYAERVGITPPQLVRMEREIESLETQSTPSNVSIVSEEEESKVREESSPQPKRTKKESEVREESPPQPKRTKKESEVREESSPQPKRTKKEPEVWEESSPQPKRTKKEPEVREESPPQPKRTKKEPEVREESPPQPKRTKKESEVREESSPQPKRTKKEPEVWEESSPQPKRTKKEPEVREESPPQPKRTKKEPEVREESPLQRKKEVPVASERRKKARKEETVDDKVVRILGQCSCKDSEKLRGERCGNGKFILRGEHLKKPGEKKMIVYARLLSDRIMVRVGGGWDSLDHFLLKHDPCRINLSVTAGSGQQRHREGTKTVLGKHRRED